MQTLSTGSTMMESKSSLIIPPAGSWPDIELFTNVTQTILGWENGEIWGDSNWGWGWNFDGTKMVIITNANDVYYGFDLSTPYDMNTAVRNTAASTGVVVGLSMSFSTDGLNYAQASWYSANPLDFYSTTVPFEPTNANRSLIGTLNMGGYSSQDMYDTIVTRDGEHIFFQTQNNNPDKFQHIKMSTPWDPSTAVLQSDEHVSTLTASGRMRISHNGLDMMTSNANDKIITHYRMTVPYDLDTMTLVSQLTTSAVGNGPLVMMNEAATQLIFAEANGAGGTDIVVRELPGPPGIVELPPLSDLTYDSVVTLATTVTGLAWTEDGTKLSFNQGIGTFYTYTAATPWSLVGLTLDGTTVFDSNRASYGHAWHPNGTKFYTCSQTGDVFSQWDVPIPNDITSIVDKNTPEATLSQFESMGMQWIQGGSILVSLWDANGGWLSFFDCATPYDISTGVLRTGQQRFSSMSGFAISDWQNGMVCSDDGLRAYCLDYNTSKVHQADLSTAFLSTSGVISTANDLTLNAATIRPRGMFVSPNEKSLYVGRNGSKQIERYTWT